MATLTVPREFTIAALAAKFGFDPKEATEFILTESIKDLQMFIRQQTAEMPKTAEIAEIAETPKPTPPTPAPRPTPKPRNRIPQPVAAAEPVAAPAVATPEQPAETPKTKTPKAPKAPKLAKPAFQLPWCNELVENRCLAVHKNYDLYTQCMNQPTVGKFCPSCAKHASETGVPKYGLITDRIGNPAWVSPVDGKAPIPFVQFWTKKLNAKGISRGDVEKEAAKFELTVPDAEWTLPEKPVRARKAKSAVVESSASGSDSEPAAAAAPAAAAPAPKPPVKKIRKTKTSPAPPVAPVAPAPEPETDMVQRSLATELAANPYDAETDEEDEDEDEEMVEEVPVATVRIDHGDGKGERIAVICPDNYIYCYTTYTTEGDLVKVGSYNDGVYTPLPAAE